MMGKQLSKFLFAGTFWLSCVDQTAKTVFGGKVGIIVHNQAWCSWRVSVFENQCMLNEDAVHVSAAAEAC